MSDTKLTHLKQAAIDQKLNQLKSAFTMKVVGSLKNKAELHYCLSAQIHDWIKMQMTALKSDMSPQEARATMKVILDSALFEYGLHARIDEFDKH